MKSGPGGGASPAARFLRYYWKNAGISRLPIRSVRHSDAEALEVGLELLLDVGDNLLTAGRVFSSVGILQGGNRVIHRPGDNRPCILSLTSEFAV